jgi:acyl-CoA reductase-like NAD-dependent aldehyde dehydrogenase
VAPTLFTDVTPAMPVARDEIFGPVTAVLRFGTEAEAVELANDTPYGLLAASTPPIRSARGGWPGPSRPGWC